MFRTHSNYLKTHDRYLFQGSEMVKEVKGEGNSYDFGARMLDPRLGRWLSIDKMVSTVPNWTPYRSFYNNPIFWTDSDGNIETPLKATQIYGPTLVKVESDFIVRKNKKYVERDQFHIENIPSIGHKSQDYEFAYRSVGYPKKTESQMQAQSQGMLATINSGFFKERTIGTSPHIGVDLKAPIGTDVYSFGDGTVIEVDYTDGTGNYIVIQYLNGDKVRFMHLSETLVTVNSKIYEGQIFAKSGNSGYKSPGVNYDPHLHIDGANSEGQMINPLEREYGRVTNEEFFKEFQGDYNKLKEIKSYEFEVIIRPQVGPQNQSPNSSQKSQCIPCND